MVHLRDIEAARRTIAGRVHRTPLIHSESFSHIAGRPVHLKAENLQRTGSFKLRGALTRLAQLSPEQAAAGVVTASAGNHGQAVALAASMQGMKAKVVVPETASLAKCEAIEGYGAQLVRHGLVYDDALAHAQALAREQGQTFVHGFDDDAIIAGQGTIGLELLDDLPDVATVIVPAGGGGLLAGIAVAVKQRAPGVRVYGVQTEAAPALARSFHSTRRLTVRPGPTIADGIAIGHPGERPMALIRRYVDDVVTVDEETIAHALVLTLERAKLLVEPAGAAPLAALLAAKLPLPEGPVVAVLSGGNIDVALLGQVVAHGLARAGRTLVLDITIPDRPGNLAPLLERLATLGVNVLEVEHERLSPRLRLGEVEVHLSLETRGATHNAEVRRALAADGFLLG